MRIAKLLCAVLTLTAPLNLAVAQTIWKWVDKNGVTHYSDQPGPGAVKVDLQVQTFAPQEGQTASSSPTKPTPSAVSYQSLDIVAPVNDATIFGAEATVTVQLQLEPALQNGHAVQLLLNGRSVGEASSSLSFSLPNLERGSHTVQANVVNGDGTVLISSQSVTFHVRMPSVNRPAR